MFSKFSTRQFLGILIICTIFLLAFGFYVARFSDDIYSSPVIQLCEVKDIEKGSIFFLETSGCQIKYTRNSIITQRQACAVESTARMNSDKYVFLLYILRHKNDSLYEFSFENDELTGKLLKYKNVQIKTIDLGDYLEGTPLESWHNSKKLDQSKYMIEHASDVLRYLTMWKYGGVYMDLDVVVMKNLEELGTDYMGAENKNYVANGVLSFNSTGFGHEVASMILEEVNVNFDGSKWSGNGPLLVTKVLRKICTVKDVNSMTSNNCKGFRVLPQSTFYAVTYGNLNHFFNHTKINEAMRMINGSFAIHAWNKLSHNIKVFKNASEVFYGKIANDFCPYVYHSSGEIF